MESTIGLRPIALQWQPSLQRRRKTLSLKREVPPWPRPRSILCVSRRTRPHLTTLTIIWQVEPTGVSPSGSVCRSSLPIFISITGAGVGHITDGITGTAGPGILGGALGVRDGARHGLGILGGVLGDRAGDHGVRVGALGDLVRAGMVRVGTGLYVMSRSAEVWKAVMAEELQEM